MLINSLGHRNENQGGADMTYGYGFGFRGTSPPWPYVGRGRGGLPRCWYPRAVPAPSYAPAVYGGYPAWGPGTYTPHMPQEQEMDSLKEESNALRRQLEEIEARIKELEAKEQ